MTDDPDMDPYEDGGPYNHLAQGYSWEHRPASFSASSIVRSSDADSDADSPANSTLYGASDASEGLQRNSSRRALACAWLFASTWPPLSASSALLALGDSLRKLAPAHHFATPPVPDCCTASTVCVVKHSHQRCVTLIPALLCGLQEAVLDRQRGLYGRPVDGAELRVARVAHRRAEPGVDHELRRTQEPRAARRQAPGLRA